MDRFRFIQKPKIRRPISIEDLVQYVDSRNDEIIDLTTPIEENPPTQINMESVADVNGQLNLRTTRSTFLRIPEGSGEVAPVICGQPPAENSLDINHNVLSNGWYIDLKPSISKRGSKSVPTTQKNKRQKTKNTSNHDGSSKTTPTRKKGKIAVTKCSTLISGNDKIPTYTTTSNGRRGNLLLINNIAFKGDKRRDGATVDHENIMELFRQMGFHLTDYKNLEKKDMETTIERYTKEEFLSVGDIQVVVIMSHGNSDHKTFVQGLDFNKVYIEWIVNQFTTSQFLNEKPKIFIIQCCRGDKQNIESTDNAGITRASKKTNKGDVLIAYATLPGFVSYRSKSGSRFIQAITEVFAEHAHDTSVEDLFKLVNAKVNHFGSNTKAIQTCSYENRDFKRCFFNP